MIWRDVLDIPVTDEDLVRTYEEMKKDDRYSTHVAVSDGRVIGPVTSVKALAIGHPADYTKINGLGVLWNTETGGSAGCL